MSWPSSTYGQNNYGDYYASAASLPAGGGAVLGGSGPPLGGISLLFDGSVVQFMEFAASTVAGAACTFTGSYINNQYQITPTTAAIQWVSHINDRAPSGLFQTNQTNAVTSFSWATTNGICNPFSTASTAAFKFMCSSSTTGLLKAVTAGTDVGNNVYNLVLVGGSNAQSPSFISQ